MLPNDKGGDEIESYGLFPKEMNMYKTYLPAFESLYKTAGQDIKLAPKCLHTEQREGSIHFIFEDLAVRNFKDVDRVSGLDMAHMKCALEKLAEFHAVSSVYEELHGPYPNEFNEGFVLRSAEDFLRDAFKVKEAALKKSIAKWGIKDTEKYIKNFVSTRI